MSSADRKAGASAHPERAPFGLPTLLGATLAALALLTSQVGAAWFVAFLVTLTGIASAGLARVLARRQGLAVPTALVVIGSASFPLLALWLGETGVLPIAAGILIVAAGSFVLMQSRPGLLPSLAGSVLSTLYIGLPAAYMVLIRLTERGPYLVVAFLLMVGAYQLAARIGSASRRSRGVGGRGWSGPVLGIVACLIAASGATRLSATPLGLSSVVGLGLIVGVAAAVGDLSGGRLRLERPSDDRESLRPVRSGFLRLLDAALLAAPAFFYGYRLYLT